MDQPINQPTIAQRSPYVVELEAGKTYYWCACGLSKKQPFCDGSHKPTKFQPVAYTATNAGEAAFCGCKHTTRQPMCDGSHKAL